MMLVLFQLSNYYVIFLGFYTILIVLFEPIQYFKDELGLEEYLNSAECRKICGVYITEIYLF